MLYSNKSPVKSNGFTDISTRRVFHLVTALASARTLGRKRCGKRDGGNLRPYGWWQVPGAITCVGTRCHQGMVGNLCENLFPPCTPSGEMGGWSLHGLSAALCIRSINYDSGHESIPDSWPILGGGDLRGSSRVIWRSPGGSPGK